MKEMIRNTQTLIIMGNISSSTLSREIKENKFPRPEKIGVALYFEVESVEKWLSKVAQRKVTIDDRLLSSKQLEKKFERSSAWVWAHFQKDKEMKSKAVYIRSRPYWLESEIHKSKELCKYLELIKQPSDREVA